MLKRIKISKFSQILLFVTLGIVLTLQGPMLFGSLTLEFAKWRSLEKRLFTPVDEICLPASLTVAQLSSQEQQKLVPVLSETLVLQPSALLTRVSSQDWVVSYILRLTQEASMSGGQQLSTGLLQCLRTAALNLKNENKKLLLDGIFTKVDAFNESNRNWLFLESVLELIESDPDVKAYAASKINDLKEGVLKASLLGRGQLHLAQDVDMLFKNYLASKTDPFQKLELSQNISFAEIYNHFQSYRFQDLQHLRQNIQQSQKWPVQFDEILSDSKANKDALLRTLVLALVQGPVLKAEPLKKILERLNDSDESVQFLSLAVVAYSIEDSQSFDEFSTWVEAQARNFKFQESRSLRTARRLQSFLETVGNRMRSANSQKPVKYNLKFLVSQEQFLEALKIQMSEASPLYGDYLQAFLKLPSTPETLDFWIKKVRDNPRDVQWMLYVLRSSDLNVESWKKLRAFVTTLDEDLKQRYLHLIFQQIVHQLVPQAVSNVNLSEDLRQEMLDFIYVTAARDPSAGSQFSALAFIENHLEFFFNYSSERQKKSKVSAERFLHSYLSWKVAPAKKQSENFLKLARDRKDSCHILFFKIPREDGQNGKWILSQLIKCPKSYLKSLCFLGGQALQLDSVGIEHLKERMKDVSDSETKASLQCLVDKAALPHESMDDIHEDDGP